MIFNKSKKILFYLLSGIFVFSIIKTVPNHNFRNIDIILMTIMIILLSRILEKSIVKNEKCVIQKSKQEHFDQFNNIETKTNINNIKNNNEPFNELMKKLDSFSKSIGSNLPKSNLSKSIKSNLPKSNLSKSNLSKSIKSNLPTSNLSKSNLSKSNLSKFNLSKSNLSKSNLSKSNLSKSNLSKFNLLKSNLSKFNLSKSSLSKSNLSKSSLSKSNLSKSIKSNSPKSKLSKLTNSEKKTIKFDALISSFDDVKPLMTVDKISFPFDVNFMKSTLNDMIQSSSNEKIATNIQLLAKSNEYYEIYIQLLQMDIESVYKYLNDDKFNMINELILNVKMKRLNLSKNPNIKKIGIRSDTRELSKTMKKYLKTLTNDDMYFDSNGIIKNIYDNDMIYSQYTPKQHQQLGTYNKDFNNGWSNDYVLLNTDKWMPPITHSMYKCKTEKTCPVCPNMTSGYPVKLKNFNLARKILPPDDINVDFITEKLLTGLA